MRMLLSLVCVTTLLLLLAFVPVSLHASFPPGGGSTSLKSDPSMNIVIRSQTVSHVRRPASRITDGTNHPSISPSDRQKDPDSKDDVFEKDLDERPEWPGCPHGVDPGKKTCLSSEDKEEAIMSPATQMRLLRHKHKTVIRPGDSKRSTISTPSP